MHISTAALYSLGGLIYLLYLIVFTSDGSEGLVEFENAFSNRHGLARLTLVVTFFVGVAAALVLWPLVVFLRFLKNFLKKL